MPIKKENEKLIGLGALETEEFENSSLTNCCDAQELEGGTQSQDSTLIYNVLDPEVVMKNLRRHYGCSSMEQLFDVEPEGLNGEVYYFEHPKTYLLDVRSAKSSKEDIVKASKTLNSNRFEIIEDNYQISTTFETEYLEDALEFRKMMYEVDFYTISFSISTYVMMPGGIQHTIFTLESESYESYKKQLIGI